MRERKETLLHFLLLLRSQVIQLCGGISVRERDEGAIERVTGRVSE